MDNGPFPMTSNQHLVLRHLLLLGALFFFTGCITSKYKMVNKDVPPAVALDRSFSAPPAVGATLRTLVVNHGPGSWKREAFWDEYVLTLTNNGDRALTIDQASIIDAVGLTYLCGDKPWKLEKEGKAHVNRIRAGGRSFVYNAAPVVIFAGIGAAIGGNAVAYIPSGIVGAVVGVGVGVPINCLFVYSMNIDDRHAIEAEFNRRRLVLPLALAPGETRTGSVFFPMMPNPRSLDLHWSSESGSGGDAVLALEFLHGIHAKALVRSVAK